DDGAGRSLLSLERRRRDADSGSLIALMETTSTGFADRVDSALADAGLRTALDRATSQLGSRRVLALTTLPQADRVRDQARAARLAALADLASNLERFETKLVANGAQVHWAETAEDANRLIVDIAKRTRTARAVKSKSMVSEETHLNDALEREG